MRWPKTTVEPSNLCLPRLLPGVGACLDLMGTSERLLYMDRVRYVWSRAIREPNVECMWHFDQVFPYRVYIDSNQRNSRI
jgi:hypothetical protein